MMNNLDVSRINDHTDIYTVIMIAEGEYEFVTSHDVLYRISFMEDYSIWQEGAYQFIISNKNNKKSPNDTMVGHTIYHIIMEFFYANPSILLYICETGDDKQMARNRLFLKWFKQYDGGKTLYLQDVEIEDDGIHNYAALIIQNTNPRFDTIIKEFNETIEILSNKPE